MPLFEAVAIEVGSAIAKSILKMWMKDSTLGDNLSSSLIDLLKSRTSDALAQRRGQRQFDTIGEKVGESLLPLFEVEGANLNEGSRIAVAHEVAAAFNKSKLSSELLSKHNLEPTELAKHVFATHSIIAQPFNDTEKAFYERIIQESCLYIVEIASQLPAFSERAFSEILKREGQLLAKADQALQAIEMIRRQLDPMVEAERFEIEYRQSIARNLNLLQLMGADVPLASRRYPLSTAYITLFVEQKSFPYFSQRHHTSAVAATSMEESPNESDTNIVSVDTALSRSRFLLIRGPAGSGKTTFLKWVAVRSATKSFEGQLSDWKELVPFYIHLRDWIHSGTPRPESFPGYVAPAIAGTMPKGWVHTLLKSGRGIILIDGIDEVSSLQREDVRTWLKELVETYPKARFIITSLPHAVEEGWMNQEGFSSVEMQPMQLSDIFSFIDHWHEAVCEEIHEEEEKAELLSLAEHLKLDVKRSRSIRNLAINPLLCAMLCALNRERRKRLPSDRIELYEACCHLMLERRDKARSIDLRDYPVLNYRQIRGLLEDLAYWMIRNGWSEVATNLVDDRFASKLKDMQNSPFDFTGSSVRRLFVERSGIIREPVSGQIDFTHHTFKEFLAAHSILEERDTGLLVNNAHNDQWHEVIILASGLASTWMREELIKGLIARGDKEKEYRYQLHLLAVSCLETSISLGQNVRMLVENRLSQLVPPKDMTDAQILAAAGDLAVKHLGKREQSDSSAAASVRALASIGSDAALEVLQEHANDVRPIVIDELIKAWDNFNRLTYAKHILSHTFRSRSHLRLERLPSLDGIQYLNNLTSLDLSYSSLISDLSPLASLTQLTSLNLSGCSQISDLTSLADLTQLSSLDLSYCSLISDLSPLASLTQLTSLNLSGCSQISDLTSLADLTQLSIRS